MTIKRSLILSHVSMCILPFLMTFFVLVSSFSGLYLYAKSGNHVMAESGFQFQAMSQVVRALIFHHIRHSKEALEDHWVLDILDPIQSYVVLYRDGEVTLQYGNDRYQQMVEDLKQQKVQQELDEGEINGTYSETRMGQYSFMERNRIAGHVYHLYMLSHKPVNRSDAAIEAAFRASNRFIVISSPMGCRDSSSGGSWCLCRSWSEGPTRCSREIFPSVCPMRGRMNLHRRCRRSI